MARALALCLALVLGLCAFPALAVKVQVMMPLTTVSNEGTLSNPSAIRSQLQQLKSAGVDSVMIDVWWGIVEQTEGRYYFDGYKDFFSIARSVGLKVAPVMSFHRCGGNVGDDCNIPLPSWVRSVANAKQLWYMDYWGNSQDEYLAGSSDNIYISSRKVIDIYRDYMDAFASTFDYLFQDGTIYEVQIGLGPCGELRYPSYPSNRWSFPGVGAFQCFNPKMLEDFKTKAAAAGHPEWTSPPTDAGSYNNTPNETSFFTNGYKTEYGKWFLDWYSSSLIEHGKRVMNQAKQAFSKYNPTLVAKVAGIHWWYGTSSHAAELTAGYYNTNNKNAYLDLANAFKGMGAVFDFTCMEMRDSEQSSSYSCKPEELVHQVEDAVSNVSWRMSGENALERYDKTGYQKVLDNVKRASGVFENFTYLRLTNELIKNQMSNFKWFVQELHNI